MAERLMIQGFEPFVGKHCETSALKRVLDYHGLSLSEDMLFGLGGGIGFIYWCTRTMPGPFIGTRNGKIPDLIADEGALGKEAMIRIFGNSALEVVDKAFQILKNFE